MSSSRESCRALATARPRHLKRSIVLLPAAHTDVLTPTPYRRGNSTGQQDSMAEQGGLAIPLASLGCMGAGNRPCGACTYESGAQLSPTADCAGSAAAAAAAFLSSFFMDAATGEMPASHGTDQHCLLSCYQAEELWCSSASSSWSSSAGSVTHHMLVRQQHMT